MDALYRITSNEVIIVSDHDLTGSKDVYTEILNGPIFSDGTDVRDSGGNLRVLGYAKINDSGTIRNATQNEIDTFAAAETEDNNIQEADNAVAYLQNDPKLRRIMIAFAATLIEHEFNENRTWFTNFQTEVAASTSLADFKTRMATLPAMPQRNLSQLRTQIDSRIDKDD